MENLYRYRSLMELFKIIKTRIPISLYSSFSLSDRKDSYLITPPPTTQFFYKSAWMWNEFRKVGTINFTSPCSLVKRQLKKSLLTTQGNFGSDWCEKNFSDFSANWVIRLVWLLYKSMSFSLTIFARSKHFSTLYITSQNHSTLFKSMKTPHYCKTNTSQP